MDITGKVAIVTGGAEGIGESITLALLEHGCKVCICDINEDKGLKLVQSLRLLKHDVIFEKCDISDFDSFEDSFEKTKEAFGHVDILVNNAAILDEHNWRKAIDINLVGVIHGIQLALKHMGINHGGSGGCVINIASVAGLAGMPIAPVYSATKHGVVGLTRSFGTDYHFERTGITVCCACPGSTDTESFRTLPDRSIDVVEAEKFVKECTSMKPNVVADGVLELIEGGRNGVLLKIGKDGVEYVK